MEERRKPRKVNLWKLPVANKPDEMGFRGIQKEAVGGHQRSES